jgi:sialate O-acetylesterase
MGVVIVGLVFSLPGFVGRAEVILAPPFQDHAVLQRGKPVPVWGRANPGEPVRVSIGRGVAVQTIAGRDGRWHLELPALRASAMPAELVVEGSNRIVVHDVLVGEVWLCSGQSNMDFQLVGATGGAPDIAGAHWPSIRQLRVARNPASSPQNTVAAAWTVCSPATAAEFTAVGFYFARDLWRALGVPVGIVASAHGDTPVEAWMSADALAGAPQFAVVAERWAHILTGKEPAKPYQAPSCLYNGMVHPLVPYALRGFLWYQGESNAARASEYERLFTTLIRQWRQDFQQGDLPFFWVQLPNLRESEMPPGTTDPDWVALRAAQTAALALPATGQAVTIDVGDPANIHPPRKREVGERLARLARRQVYGERIADRGPEPAEVSESDGVVRVRFAPAGQGPELHGDQPAAFEVAGADGIFVPATEARLDRGDLVVGAKSVRHPVAIRYAWHAAAVATIFNHDGLPAAPFLRTIK